jgi:hypothetical protein
MAEVSVVANGRNKYAVLDRSDDPDLDAGQARQRKQSASESERRQVERFVYTCAIFASLNAILLGYGEFLCDAASQWHPRLRMEMAPFSLTEIVHPVNGIVASIPTAIPICSLVIF